MLRKLLATAALIAAPLAASAQGNLAFQGFYGGVQLGYYMPDSSTATTDLGNGHNFGLFAGYNHALGQDWIVGGELGYGSTLTVTPMPGMDLNFEDMLSVRGRVGYVFDDIMLYGSLGYMTTTLSTNISPVTADASGITYGLGAEMMLNQNWSARIEYMGSDLDLNGTGASVNTNGIGMGLVFHF